MRGATVKVMRKGAPMLIKRPVQKLYPVKLSGREGMNEQDCEDGGKVAGRVVKQVKEENEMENNEEIDSGNAKNAKRGASLDAQWKINRQLNKI